jgi:hypothetical protein
MADLELTHPEIVQIVSRDCGYGREPYSALSPTQKALIDQAVDTAYRSFLNPDPLPGKRSRHRWSFLWPETTLTLSATYSTGTIEVTADAGGSMVEGTGTTFPTWAAQGELTPNAGTTYTVSTYTDGDSLLLDDTAVTVAAGTSYTLGRVEYDLPSDFGGFEGRMTYRPGASTAYEPIEFTSWSQIRRARQFNRSTSTRPTAACCVPKTHAPTAAQGWKLIFDYPSNGAYVLQYRYKVNVSAIDATNLYPVCGPNHSETLLAGCLYHAARYRGEDGAAVQAAKQYYQERLAASIAEDECMIEETVGVMHDPSDDDYHYPYRMRHDDTGVNATYNGTVFY